MENNTITDKCNTRINSVFHIVTNVNVLLAYPVPLDMDLVNIKDFKVIGDILFLQLSDE